jgi:hypothetical protein
VLVGLRKWYVLVGRKMTPPDLLYFRGVHTGRLLSFLV